MKKGIPEIETRIEKIRRVELDTVKPWFRPGMRVLEIGGGNGFQAKLLSSWGCQVDSLDVQNRPNWPVTYFEVKTYDGVNIPFSAQSFDMIFSSNVLEHVLPDNLQALLQETRRVMKPRTAISIHILPTPSWRFWNNLAHYPYLVKYLSGYGKTAMMPTIPTRDQALKENTIFSLVQRAILPRPHGEYPSALSELYFFSQRRWVREFGEAGLACESTMNTNIFYTGYGLSRKLHLPTRCWLSRILGNSTRGYILRAT
ncbi:MAG: class I SAM-dependent methyltransferase [Blastocatellia bacterium]